MTRSLLSAIIKDTPQPITELKRELPRDLSRIVQRCLAKDSEDRYQTAKDLAVALEDVLAAKGYPAYVVTPQKGAPSMYRVRVGKYKDRREADTVAARLQKEEQFKPWIVR